MFPPTKFQMPETSSKEKLTAAAEDLICEKLIKKPNLTTPFLNHGTPVNNAITKLKESFQPPQQFKTPTRQATNTPSPRVLNPPDSAPRVPWNLFVENRSFLCWMPWHDQQCTQHLWGVWQDSASPSQGLLTGSRSMQSHWWHLWSSQPPKFPAQTVVPTQALSFAPIYDSSVCAPVDTPAPALVQAVNSVGSHSASVLTNPTHFTQSPTAQPLSSMSAFIAPSDWHMVPDPVSDADSVEKDNGQHFGQARCQISLKISIKRLHPFPCHSTPRSMVSTPSMCHIKSFTTIFILLHLVLVSIPMVQLIGPRRVIPSSLILRFNLSMWNWMLQEMPHLFLHWMVHLFLHQTAHLFIYRTVHLFFHQMTNLFLQQMIHLFLQRVHHLVLHQILRSWLLGDPLVCLLKFSHPTHLGIPQDVFYAWLQAILQGFFQLLSPEMHLVIHPCPILGGSSIRFFKEFCVTCSWESSESSSCIFSIKWSIGFSKICSQWISKQYSIQSSNIGSQEFPWQSSITCSKESSTPFCI